NPARTSPQKGAGRQAHRALPFPVPRSLFPLHLTHALPLLPAHRHPGHRLARVRRRRHHPAPARLRGLRGALQHDGDDRAEAAGDHQVRWPARSLRCPQAARRFRPCAAEAAGGRRADRGRGPRGGAPVAHECRTRAAFVARGRVRHGRAAQARPRGLRALRFRLPRLQGRGGFPRGARPAREGQHRRRPAAVAARGGHAAGTEETLTGFTATDHLLMARALRLAAHGAFTTRPNPMVGCVIAHGDEVVGEGWHQRAGQAHAETLALQAAGERARGATAYVTLEPCAHTGSTPPCADALIAAGVARVVAAMRDPFPQVDGAGFDRLKAAGIEVAAGLMEKQARDLNRGYLSRMVRGRPWVRVKLATSLDGRSALASGESKWISGEASRLDVQQWRARSGAILTGAGTVLADDPSLTVRLGDDTPFEPPLRVVLDAGLATIARGRVREGDA